MIPVSFSVFLYLSFLCDVIYFVVINFCKNYFIVSLFLFIYFFMKINFIVSCSVFL